MKLINKKTGEIGEINYYDNCIQVVDTNSQLCGNSILGDYRSLAELCEEWEDYEEPKVPAEYWFLNDLNGEPMNIECSKYFGMHNYIEHMSHRKEIGNYFETKEEAEKAVRKLKAWKRLKDKGFKFTGINDDEKSQYSCNQTGILCEINEGEKPKKLCKDNDFLAIFGGEE